MTRIRARRRLSIAERPHTQGLRSGRRLGQLLRPPLENRAGLGEEPARLSSATCLWQSSLWPDRSTAPSCGPGCGQSCCDQPARQLVGGSEARGKSGLSTYAKVLKVLLAVSHIPPWRRQPIPLDQLPVGCLVGTPMKALLGEECQWDTNRASAIFKCRTMSNTGTDDSASDPGKKVQVVSPKFGGTVHPVRTRRPGIFGVSLPRCHCAGFSVLAHVRGQTEIHLAARAATRP